MGNRLKFGSSFGVMQGRLSQQTPQGYQAFPQIYWQEEFKIAESLNFDHIEWIVDHNYKMNPIFNTVLLKKFFFGQKVKVLTVCGDYFMNHRLDNESEATNTLIELVDAMQSLEIQYLVLPFVDQSSSYNVYGKKNFLKALFKIDESIKSYSTKIAIECDLNSVDLCDIFTEINLNRFSINYDIGNSAALGYNHFEELDAYAKHIKILHIKDRVIGGASVPLGTGDAKIMQALKELKPFEENIITTLQCFRDLSGIEILRDQKVYLEKLLKNL